jgi:RNA polymerase sigma-70 factor (ECF subfamily)
MSSELARLRVLPGGAGAPSRHLAPSQPLDDLNDAQVVALALSDDVVAAEALYRRYAAFAMNLAVRLQGSAHDVEDVVHDAFIRALGRLEELRDPAAFRAWLGSIVVRQVRTRLRRKRLLGALGLVTAEPVDLDAIASPEAGPDARAQLAQIYALLQTMPAADRVAWTLRHVEREKLEAVAELCACSLATAKRRIVRAQRFLEQHFVSPIAEVEA